MVISIVGLRSTKSRECEQFFNGVAMCQLFSIVIFIVIFHSFSGCSSCSEKSRQYSWTDYQYDPGHTGQTDAEGPSKLAVKWSIATGKMITASPSIDQENRIFMSVKDDSLYCLDSTGGIQWEYKLEIGAGERVFPSIDYNGNIYFPESVLENDEAPHVDLVSLDRNGQVRWKLEIDDRIISSAAIDNEAESIFITTFYKQELYRISFEGDTVFQSKIGPSEFLPTLHQNRGIILTVSYEDFSGESSIVKAIEYSGECLWTKKFNHHIIVPLTLSSKGDILVCDSVGSACCMNLEGDTLWQRNFPEIDQFRSSAAIGNNGDIFLCGNNFSEDKAYVIALGYEGNDNWKVKLDYIVYNSSPAIDKNGNIYIGSIGGIYIITQSGSISDYFNGPYVFYSSPAIGAEKKMYIGDLEGNIYCFGGT